IEDLFGLNSDEDEDEEKAKRFRLWYSSIAKDFFPLAVGTLGENASVAAMNRVAHLFDSSDLSYSEWLRETKGGTFYSYKSSSPLSDLGLYSIGLERVQRTINDMDAALSGDATFNTFWGEKEVSL